MRPMGFCTRKIVCMPTKSEILSIQLCLYRELFEPLIFIIMHFRVCIRILQLLVSCHLYRYKWLRFLLGQMFDILYDFGRVACSLMVFITKNLWTKSPIWMKPNETFYFIPYKCIDSTQMSMSIDMNNVVDYLYKNISFSWLIINP